MKSAKQIRGALALTVKRMVSSTSGNAAAAAVAYQQPQHQYSPHTSFYVRLFC